MKRIEIEDVKILNEKLSIGYTTIEGDREVVGSSTINTQPTATMLSHLKVFSQALAHIFYYGDKTEEWKKSSILATGFKVKWVSEDFQGIVITGKLRLESNKWVALNSDLIGFEENAYGLFDLKSDVDDLKFVMKEFFFGAKGGAQAVIDAEEEKDEAEEADGIIYPDVIDDNAEENEA